MTELDLPDIAKANPFAIREYLVESEAAGWDGWDAEQIKTLELLMVDLKVALEVMNPPKRYVWEAKIIACHDFCAVRHLTYHATEDGAKTAGDARLAELQAADPEWAYAFELTVDRIELQN